MHTAPLDAALSRTDRPWRYGHPGCRLVRRTRAHDADGPSRQPHASLVLPFWSGYVL